MAAFGPPPVPPTNLGRYRILSPHAGVRVSPIQLGGASIGNAWEGIGMKGMNQEDSFKLLDAYFKAGGNFLDTANSYQNGESERIIGEWLESRGIRDQLVIATKFSIESTLGNPNIHTRVNFSGNSAKSIKASLTSSLKKLRTTYIDILYLHFWDFSTSIKEVMDHLHNLVVSGQVLYLGISDTPAWVVSQANQYAIDNGKTPFAIYQGAWNVMERSFERDIIPMARTNGLALAPWNVLAGGKLRSDAEEARREASGEKGRSVMSPSWKRNEVEKKVSGVLQKIAVEVGLDGDNVGAVAIAYLLQKTPYVFPIIGGRKVEHLLANIEALRVSLSEEQIKEIESVVPFDPGFPNNFIGDGTTVLPQVINAGVEDRVTPPQAIRPAKTA